MLIKLKDNKIVGYVNVGSPTLELEYLEIHDDLVQVQDTVITEDLKYYEIIEEELQIVSNIDELKDAEAAEELLKELHDGEIPEYNVISEKVELDGEEIIDGKRYTKYVVIPKTEDELQAYYEENFVEPETPEHTEATQNLIEDGFEVIDGTVYKKYIVTEKTPEEIVEYQTTHQLEIKQAMVLAIENLIQSKVDDYNEEHSLSFANIDSCTKYTLTPEYSHYQFCVDVIKWQTSVWEYARQVQTDVMNGTRTMPLLEELLAELPVFGE